MSAKYNYIIVGAGIVGLATAVNLLKLNPRMKVLILEKENRLGVHQTGNNSGVIHSGIYYRPGSKKALNCQRGYKLLLEFCKENEIDFDICGKLIVATSEIEVKQLDLILKRGEENGLENLRILDQKEMMEYEPHVKGLKAIHVPQTGIIDFKTVLDKYTEELVKHECIISFNSNVVNISEGSDSVKIVTDNENYTAEYVIVCAGLQSDRLAKQTEPELDFRIIPFRGEYYKLNNESLSLVTNLIYPVPDPAFPFLGVHFTRKMNGEVEAGPNAVLSFAREGYGSDKFDFKDSLDTFLWPGFYKIVSKYWKMGLGEFYRSFSKKAFVAALQKLVPTITENDLKEGGVGIRAQACDIKGNLIDDFYFKETKRVLHVCNAPSPAATASLAIGESIAKNFV